MIKNFKRISFPLLIIILLINEPIFAQSNIKSTLAKEVIPLSGVEPRNDLKDLIPLKKFLKDKEIVGLGEATHGTRDFIQMRHRMIKFLVTEMDFKVLVFEAYFADTEKMNDYILYGKGNVYNAIIGMGFGIYYTEGMLEMMEWLRSYNKDKSEKDKVRIYGCDMQAPQVAASKVKAFLEERGVLTESCAKKLDWMIDRPFRKKYPRDERKIIRGLLDDLDIAFQRLPPPKSLQEQKLFHYKRILEQSADYMLTSWRYKAGVKRDKYMAENCLFIRELEKNKKMILCAHNGHIAKGRMRKRLGNYLFETYGEKYYSIGLGFNSGKFTALNMATKRKEAIAVGNAIAGSSDALFSKCKYPVFFIDFNSMDKNTELYSILDKKIISRSVGERYYPERKGYIRHKLLESYDGLIFVRETSASISLNWKLLDN